MKIGLPRQIGTLSGSDLMPGPAPRPRRVACGVHAGIFALAVSGCAVAPNFSPPPAPPVDTYLPGKLATPDGGKGGPRVAGQRFVRGADVSARWWAAFRSPGLDDLVRQSVEHNPTLQSAEGAIKVAYYNALAQRGVFFPQVTGNSTSSQFFDCQSRPGAFYSNRGSADRVFAGDQPVTVSFVPDVWGANFRSVENLDAVTENQLFQLEAAYLALTSNVATAAIQEASLRRQIAATQRIIAIVRNSVDILNRMFKAGQVAQADVLQQEAQLAAVEQLLPPLERQLAQQRDLLTALAGQLSADEIEQKFDLAHLKLPLNLPISLPSKLVGNGPMSGQRKPTCMRRAR
jgi:NodT family efflux transporter outer membrane factor (OMF) lipoprotein